MKFIAADDPELGGTHTALGVRVCGAPRRAKSMLKQSGEHAARSVCLFK